MNIWYKNIEQDAQLLQLTKTFTDQTFSFLHAAPLDYIMCIKLSLELCPTLNIQQAFVLTPTFPHSWIKFQMQMISNLFTIPFNDTTNVFSSFFVQQYFSITVLQTLQMHVEAKHCEHMLLNNATKGHSVISSENIIFCIV